MSNCCTESANPCSAETCSMSMDGASYFLGEASGFEKVFEKAKPDTNAAEILEYLAQA